MDVFHFLQYRVDHVAFELLVQIYQLDLILQVFVLNQHNHKSGCLELYII